MLITIYIIEGESSFEGYGFDLLESGEERGEFSIYIKKLPDATILKVWSLLYNKELEIEIAVPFEIVGDPESGCFWTPIS